ncbi:MAG: glycosyltransferase family 4 protein [Armatimonadota bacterium]
MRHLLVAPYLPGPLRPRLQGIAAGLRDWGDFVTVVGLDLGEPWRAPEGVEVVPVRVAHPQAGARALRAFAQGRSASVAWCDAPDWTAAVRDQYARIAPDRVHLEHVRCASLIPVLRGVGGTFDAVDCVSGLYERIADRSRPGPRRWAREREALALRVCETAMADWADRIVATTPDEAGELTRRTGRAVAVLPNAPVPAGPAFDPGTAPPRAVVVGRWGHPPNRDGLRWLLAEVWPRIVARVPGARLKVVGPNLGRWYLPASVGATVEWVGWLPDPRLIHEDCRLALAPLAVGAGISNKCLEALAAGIPVVATRSAARGLPGAVESGALRVADAPVDFVESAARWLEDAGLAAEMGRKGRAWCGFLPDWKSCVAQLREPRGNARRP